MTAAISFPWRTALDAALNLFYPPVCRICGEERAAAAEGYVGPACRGGVKLVTAPFCQRCGLPFEGAISQPFQCANCQEMTLYFRSARSAVVADALMLDVIHRYKYNRSLWFEPFLAGLLLRETVPALRGQKWDLIVPVPLHPLKQREREFNQAERLAIHLSAAIQIPLNKNLLRRVVFTNTQTRLTRQERAANMRGAFAMRHGARLNGERVILVDDVFTTGATTSACALALLAAGADDVCVWTVARGL